MGFRSVDFPRDSASLEYFHICVGNVSLLDLYHLNDDPNVRCYLLLSLKWLVEYKCDCHWLTVREGFSDLRYHPPPFGTCWWVWAWSPPWQIFPAFLARWRLHGPGPLVNKNTTIYSPLPSLISFQGEIIKAIHPVTVSFEIPILYSALPVQRMKDFFAYSDFLPADVLPYTSLDITDF